MTNTQPVETQPQTFTFDLYELNKGDRLIVSSKNPKRIEVKEQDITIHNLVLFERSVIYLSPSQQIRLPEVLRDNSGFMNYIKACRFMIPDHCLPITQPDHQFNSNEALRLMTLSAAQGFAPAQWNLGICSQFGIGMEKNLIQALDYYQKAAEQGLAKAQIRLASLYHHGHGLPKNPMKAFEWYEKAAIQGIAVAQYNLGWYYAQGIHVSQDLTKALDYYQKAFAQGFAEAKNGINWVNQEIERAHSKAQQEEAARAQRTQPDLGNPFYQILSKMQEREDLHRHEMQAMEKRHQEEMQRKEARHQKQLDAIEKRIKRQGEDLIQTYEASIRALDHRLEIIESRILDHQIIRWTLEGQTSALPISQSVASLDRSLDNISIEEFSEAPKLSPARDPKPEKRVMAANGNSPKRQQTSPQESAQ